MFLETLLKINVLQSPKI